MSKTNAIERLLRHVPRENHEHHCAYFFPTGDEEECDCGLFERRSDALAAVDALYQAAKEFVATMGKHPGSGEPRGYSMASNDAAVVLAAAVRRVEDGA